LYEKSPQIAIWGSDNPHEMRKGIAGESLHIFHPEAQVKLADVTQSQESAQSEAHVYKRVSGIRSRGHANIRLLA
jgi:hypothetical protein